MRTTTQYRQYAHCEKCDGYTWHDMADRNAPKCLDCKALRAKETARQAGLLLKEKCTKE